MKKFIKFKTSITKNLGFVDIDSIFMVTSNFVYYTYGDKIESELIDENIHIDIANQINALDNSWIDIHDYVTNENETRHFLIREKSINALIKKYDTYELKLEHNSLPAEIKVTAMTDEDAKGLINYLSK